MAAITVTTTPTLLVCPEPNSTAPTAQETAAAKNNNGGSSPGIVILQNQGAVSVFFAGDTSEGTDGAELTAGSTFTTQLPSGRNLYAVTASGSAACRVVVL